MRILCAAEVVVCYRAMNERSEQRFGAGVQDRPNAPTVEQVGFGWYAPFGLLTPAEGRILVDGVDLAVSRGDLVGIVGPNGSGKTTLLKTLNPSQGLTIKATNKENSIAAEAPTGIGFI